MPKRVLVVDDEAEIAQFNIELLRRTGYQAEACQDTGTALRQIAQSDFDLLLTDLNLGCRADGFVLAGALKLMHPQARVLLVTGNPDLAGAWKTIQEFVDGVLMKPVSGAVMRAAVEWVEKPKSARAEPVDLSTLIERYCAEIMDDWLENVEADPIVNRVGLERHERLDDLHAVLKDVALHMRQPDKMTLLECTENARRHGRLRRQEGYAIPALLREASHIRQAITRLLSRHFLELNPDRLLPDLFSMNASVDENLLQSLCAFSEAAPRNSQAA